MEVIKQYKPSSNSLSSGQVLHAPYSFEKARLVVHEMTELLVLDMVAKGILTDQVVLTIGYDINNLADPEIMKRYTGAVTTDYYGRKTPKYAHGTTNLMKRTSSTKRIVSAVMELFDRIVDKNLYVRRLNIAATRIVGEECTGVYDGLEQLDLFTDYETLQREREAEEAFLSRERKAQEAVLTIRKKHGNNAILKGMNLIEGATAKDRNSQIGGHKA
jgi:DNA polymerase V